MNFFFFCETPRSYAKKKSFKRTVLSYNFGCPPLEIDGFTFQGACGGGVLPQRRAGAN